MNSEAASQEPILVIAGLGLIAGCLAELAALTLGIIGLCEPRTKKGFAVGGIVFSGLTFIFFMGLMVIGIVTD
jgi:hypothetical protein